MAFEHASPLADLHEPPGHRMHHRLQVPSVNVQTGVRRCVGTPALPALDEVRDAGRDHFAGSSDIGKLDQAESKMGIELSRDVVFLLERFDSANCGGHDRRECRCDRRRENLLAVDVRCAFDRTLELCIVVMAVDDYIFAGQAASMVVPVVAEREAPSLAIGPSVQPCNDHSADPSASRRALTQPSGARVGHVRLGSRRGSSSRRDIVNVMQRRGMTGTGPSDG